MENNFVHYNHSVFCGKSHPAWNRGLTKETDERVKKISNTWKERFAKGLIKTRDYSAEERQQLSLRAIKNIQNRKNKILTNPEKLFIDLMRELGYGIKISKYIEDNYALQSDANGEIYFQYPINRYLCDFVYLSRKTIFRVQGDYWHCNPKIYTDEEKFTKSQRNNLHHDKNAKIYFESHGWKVLDVWESDLLYRFQMTKQMIKKYLYSNNETFEFEQDANWDKFLQDKFLAKKPKAVKQKHYCIDCGKEIWRNAKRCKPCADKKMQKVQRPSKKALEQEIETYSFLSLGKKYGVSDNTVRKWCKGYDIEIPSRGYRIKKQHENYIPHTNAEHGTFGRYKFGCRCELCLEARRKYRRQKYANMTKEQRDERNRLRREKRKMKKMFIETNKQFELF